MKIWMNTELGDKLGASTNNPDTEAFRIVHFLRVTGRATTDQIVEGARAPSAASILARMARRDPPIVVNLTGGSLDNYSSQGGDSW